MRTLTKTGIRVLTKRYISVLKKCAILNAMVLMLGTSPSFADDVYVSFWMGLKGAIAGDANPIYVNGNITRGASDEDITISRTLSIIGTETGKYLSGADTYKGLAIASDTNLTLENITMQNFKNSDFGGAIYNEGTISITGDFASNSTTGAGGAIANYFGGTIYNIEGDFSENSATEYDGGAIANMYGTIHNIEGDFTSNSADGAGGAIYNTGTIEGITGNFEQNSANLYGGAIYNSGTIGTATGGIEGKFENNTAAQKGGAIYNEGVISTITGVDDGTGNIVAFKGNSADQNGGAIYNNTNSTTAMNITGDFISNSAKSGGAIYNDRGIIGDIKGDFESNSAAGIIVTDGGGAIYNTGTIRSIDGNFDYNSSYEKGGAIYNTGIITNITGSFNNNQVTNNDGGAIYNTGTIGTITGVDDGTGNIIAFKGNSSGQKGGAIYNNTTSTTEMNIIGDFIENSAKSGGAIYNDKGIIGDITGDFESNQVSTFGGAIYNKAKINTINGNFNSNKSDSSGGAIYNSGEITNISGNFTNNSAKNYGGVLFNNNAASIVNFVAENRDITFSGNYVTSDTGFGGAIVNNGTVGLYAVNAGDKIEFTGTTPTEIPVGVTPKDIDGIYNRATLNINGFVKDSITTKYLGTVNLYNVTDDATARGTTTIYGGTVNANGNITQKNIDVKSGATLNSTTNGASIVANDTFTNAGTVNISGDDSKLAAKNLTNNGTIDVVNVVTEVLLTNNNTINAKGIEVVELTNNSKIEADNILAGEITNNGNITTTDIKINSVDNNSGASLTVNGKINGNGGHLASLINAGEVTFNGDSEKLIKLDNYGTVNFNGALDVSGSELELVQYGEGTINFSTTAIESTANCPIKAMDGGSVNIADGNVNTLHIGQLYLERNTNFAMDADLAAESMDKIKIHDVANSIIAEGKVININKINLLSATTEDKVSLDLFADDATKIALINNVHANINGLQYSPTYIYDAKYSTDDGTITFTRTEQANPYLYAPSTMAQTTANITGQIAGLAMDKLDAAVTDSEKGLAAGDMPKASNAWVKVMGFDDDVDFKHFNSIDSKAYTLAAGFNTDKVQFDDVDAAFGIYGGYIGGRQKYTGNEIAQKGGYIGLSSELTIGNAFLLSTVNSGFINNEAENMYGTDKFDTRWLGVGLKGGYNYALTDTWTLQPNVYAGYTFVNTEDYTSNSGVNIKTDNLHFFEIDPGFKLSNQIDKGWIGYIQGKYAIVMDNGGDTKATDVALPDISHKNYFEYGIGMNKSLTDAWSLNGEINRRDGGRTGWNGSVEFKYNF